MSTRSKNYARRIARESMRIIDDAASAAGITRGRIPESFYKCQHETVLLLVDRTRCVRCGHEAPSSICHFETREVPVELAFGVSREELDAAGPPDITPRGTVTIARIGDDE